MRKYGGQGGMTYIGRERREFGRRKLRQLAWVVVPGRPRLPCVVSNLSVRGALLELEPPKWLPFRFAVQFASSAEQFECELRHVAATGVGVCLVDEKDKASGGKAAARVTESDDWMGHHAASTPKAGREGKPS